MTYGDPLSRILGMKGIASEMPLGRSLSVSSEAEASRRAAEDPDVQSVITSNRSKPQADPIRVDYTSAQGAATMGLDPMVSSASVIHELAYGRIKASMPVRGASAEYPIPRDSVPQSLDIIV